MLMHQENQVDMWSSTEASCGIDHHNTVTQARL